jgi:hypothetical protein
LRRESVSKGLESDYAQVPGAKHAQLQKMAHLMHDLTARVWSTHGSACGGYGLYTYIALQEDWPASVTPGQSFSKTVAGKLVTKRLNSPMQHDWRKGHDGATCPPCTVK